MERSWNFMFCVLGRLRWAGEGIRVFLDCRYVMSRIGQARLEAYVACPLEWAGLAYVLAALENSKWVWLNLICCSSEDGELHIFLQKLYEVCGEESSCWCDSCSGVVVLWSQSNCCVLRQREKRGRVPWRIMRSALRKWMRTRRGCFLNGFKLR